MSAAAPSSVSGAERRAADAPHAVSAGPARSWYARLEDTPRGRLLQLAIFLSPVGLAALRVPVCPSALLFHQACPGCGLTRAALALARGDLLGATALQPLSPVVVPVVAALALRGGWAWVRHARSELATRTTTLVGLVVSIALVVVWAARHFGAFGGPVPVWPNA